MSSPLIANSPTFQTPIGNELYLINGNSVKAQPPVSSVKFQVLSVKIQEINPKRDNTLLEGNNPLLKCLIQKESSGNELAYNPKDTDGRPKYGLLQFDKATWNEWCVNKYKLPNDIWNGKIQIQCFNLMVADKQLWRWPPASRCLRNIK